MELLVVDFEFVCQRHLKGLILGYLEKMIVMSDDWICLGNELSRTILLTFVQYIIDRVLSSAVQRHSTTLISSRLKLNLGVDIPYDEQL